MSNSVVGKPVQVKAGSRKVGEGVAKVALLAGASGLVGSRLLTLLLEAPEYARVHALSRRPLPLEHPRLANRVLRFDAPLETQLKGFTCQDAFCCLGTTLAAAGSQAAFRTIDHDLIVRFARAALAAGAERLVCVSSVGANADSKQFYLRVKGETELSLGDLRFRSLDLLQPSLLLGARREWRLLELLAQPAMWLIRPVMVGPWVRWRAIEAQTVAAAMRGAARSGRLGVHRYTYEGLCRLAAAGTRQPSRL